MKEHVTKLPISIFIIAYNEADRIGRTLEAISFLAEEIIVLDSYSTDKTVEIAKSYGAKVFQRAWKGYGPQKRYGEDLCNSNWILNLDADEVLTEKGIEEIRNLFNTPSGFPDLQFYRFRINTVYPGDRKPRPFANDLKFIRLYNRNEGRFSPHPTDDVVLPPKNAKIGKMKQQIYHYSMRSLTHMRIKLIGYFKAQALIFPLRPLPVLIFRLIIDFPFWFLKYYFLKRHITGGYKGFIFSFWYAVARTYRTFIFVKRSLSTKKS